MKPANSVLMRSNDTESAGTTAPQCRESFYLFRLSTLTGADQSFPFSTAPCILGENQHFNDGKNVWTKGDGANYDIITKKKLNTANILTSFREHIFPVLKDSYPGGVDDGISPEAAMNFMKFLNAVCFDPNRKDMNSLNAFKTISTDFGTKFNVDLRSLKGPYADVANYKEDVIAKHELV